MRQRHHHRRFSRSKGELAAGFLAKRTAQSLLVLTLCVLPLIWGGRTPEGWGLAGLTVLAAGCCWILGLTLRGNAHFYAIPGFLILFLLIGASLCQLSPTIAAICAPEYSVQLWHQAERIIGESLAPSIAVLPEVHTQFLLMWAMVGLFFILGCQMFSTKRGILLLASTVLLIAAVGAVAGILQYVDGSPWVFGLYKGKATAAAGYYANKNHFAMLQEFGIFSGLGMVASIHFAGHEATVSTLFGRWRKLVLCCSIAATVICLLALCLSYSRAGIFCTLIGLLVFLSYVIFMRYNAHNALIIMCIVVASLALVSIHGIEPLLYKLELALSGEDASGLIRYEIWKTALKLIALSPWVGFGFGGFRFTSPTLEDCYVPGKIFFYAHNDFLELAVSVGIPIALGMLFLFVWQGKSVIRRLLQHRHSSLSYLGIASVTGMIVALGHEFFDYGLQCSANLLIFCTLAIIAWHCARLLWERDVTHEPSPGWKFGRLFYILPCLCMIVSMSIAQPFWNYWLAGKRIAYIEDLTTVPELRNAHSFSDRQRTLIRQCHVALLHIPDYQDALAPLAEAERKLAFAELSIILASHISSESRFPVSIHQIWNNRYQNALAQALEKMAPEERKRVASLYSRAVASYMLMLKGNPADALILSAEARTLDDVARWSTEKDYDPAATQLYAQARHLYPSHGEVSQAAVEGYWRRLESMSTTDPDWNRTKTLFEESIQAAAAQLPDSLPRILHFAWTFEPEESALKRITPDTIQGQEALYLLLNEQGHTKGALEALARMENLNNSRPEEETPETMGILPYLRREKRSPQQVALRIAEAAVPLCWELEDAEEQASWEAKLQSRRWEFVTPQIERVDDLMKNGDYRLAEEVLKPLGDDPRALLRYARIAYQEQRIELYNRLMERLAPTANLLDANDETVYEELQSGT